MGHVQNQLGEVEVVAIGAADIVESVVRDLIEMAPPLSSPSIVSIETVETIETDEFYILESRADSDAEIFVPPDYFMCDDCRRELKDPTDRRLAYPFINCTQCGPR